MTSNIEHISKLQALIDQYDLAEPVPAVIQDEMTARMGFVYKNIMKRAGYYSIFSGIAIYLYFAVKKSGIGVIILKSIVSAIIMTSAVYGAYRVYISLKSAPEPVKIDHLDKKAIDASNKPAQKNKTQIIYTMGILPAPSATVDKDAVESIARNIVRELSAIKGREFSTILKTSGNARTRYKLILSVEKLEKATVMFIKIIDRRNSEIVFSATERANSAGKMEEASRKAARAVAKRF